MQESDRYVSFLKRHTYATRLSKDKNPCLWDETCFKRDSEVECEDTNLFTPG